MSRAALIFDAVGRSWIRSSREFESNGEGLHPRLLLVWLPPTPG